MKWLKMDCDAQENLDMKKMIDEWGWEWYGRYWAILGKIGMLVTESRQTFALQTNNGRPFPVKLLANDLGTNVERLENFLAYLSDNHLIDKRAWDEKRLIFCPKLRDRADEYTKKLLTKSRHSPEQEVEVDTEGEKEKTKDFAPRKSAKDAKELDAKDFVLRLDAGEFAIFVESVRRAIAKENGSRPNGSFVWKHVTGSMENDLKALIYKIPDEEKKSILLDAYKILGERMNWPKYVLKCIELTLRASEKQPIHKPYGYVLALLKSPQSVISATTEGTLAGSIGRGRYV
jgi:hypothetical protein